MARFAARRLAQAVAAIVITTMLTYYGLFVMHDPFATNNGRVVPPEIKAALDAKFGMDEPLPVRYVTYLANLVTGDLGIDFQRRREVSDLIVAALPNTVRLALIAIMLQLVIGLVAGVIAAIHRSRFLDVLISTSTVLLLGIPIFVLAVVLRSELAGLTVFGVEVFPGVPLRFTTEVPWFKEVALPAVTLAVGEVAVIARIARAAMLDVLTADFLRTARAKGVAEWRVVFHHGLRNALIPVVHLVGIGLGTTLGGAFLVEEVFEYPGLGYLFFRSIGEKNDPVVMAITVYATITFVLLSALADLVSAYLDPRIRIQ
ncbi:ABC transporter permease [Actinophytocola gossypii]|uniref:ABC transporter permease n=1 Tax=Actinophytocola gossypii TaxID=2812003 RepID=A0ABT2JHY4_9PSEU|nr:ABC transporter permease [Actinophytocola gossypii]MCT2587495.1 ABC transporter permease [Actinophytocola gossypii]